MRTTIRVALALALCLACAPWAASRSDAGKLADDGRAGDVTSVQGTALVRPPDRLRWTPLRRRDLVLPGDVIRTAPRGAHALEVRLGGAELLLGPGTTIEVKGRAALHLRQGVLEVKADDKHPITVTGGGDFRQEVTRTLWAQSDARTVSTLSEPPAWLKRYRASTSNEWMGALVANVDGREVSLAVGSYNVVAEVRDQIARTTIEQGFVNTTDSTLEGVFYFPLPAGASISGFGMWIGDELVEADIVERQRARQIYEDILRRKKDPGLLEWEGGNLFKARVFPIFPHSTKRIRIRYTQVLPLEGRTFRYRHALRSELLRSKPLRDLNVVVRVDASAGIEQVGSTTHDVQVSKTDTTAEVRFAAQEFTPENDFELSVRLKQPAPVAFLPHRRGEDGYFLLQLSPPGADAGGWERELVPEGEPLDIVVVADTSGSMDEGARRSQDRFLTALAQVLGEKDRVRLLAYDVEPVWIAKDPVAADSDDWADALHQLRQRRSLGWSDIDKAMQAAAGAVAKDGFVLYLGDGVGTTGDADPQALADRLRNAHDGLVVHAVAPSSSYEAPVLEALAALGGGTMRPVGSHPAQTAAQLLGEALRPMVRDLKVSIEGIQTARVYPHTLPNLPIGMQQSVLGRFLPAAQAQRATVVVKGVLEDRPVTYRTEVTVPPTDGGNSFLPRLWGRRHIDALLEQGRPKEIQAEIVEFSERFGIMTPYTSFLVLESDEDRERYGVERRVRMRDGERFFAEARDKVALEARRDAVRRASGWRTRQRHEVLRELARLGRDLPIPYPFVEPAMNQGLAVGSGGGAGGDVSGFGFSNFDSARRTDDAWGPPVGGAKRGKMAPGRERLETRGSLTLREGEAKSEPSDAGISYDAPAASAPMSPAPDASLAAPESEGLDGIEDFEDEELDEDAEGRRAPRKRRASRELASRTRQQGYYRPPRESGAYSVDARRNRTPWPVPPQPWSLTRIGFPPLPPPFERPERSKAEDPWPEAERKLLRSLERRGDVADDGRGLHVTVRTKSRHALRKHVTSASRLEAWIGVAQWRIQLAASGGSEPREHWVASDTRGALHRARRLARKRPAEKLDGEAWSLPLWDLGVTSTLDRWEDAGYVPKITKRTDTRVEVTLRRADAKSSYLVLEIDPARRVILEIRTVAANNDLLGTTRSSGHVLVGARHYPTRIESLDKDGHVVSERAFTWAALDTAALEKALVAVATLPDDVLVVKGKLPKVVTAKQARHEGKAGFVEHLTLALDAAGRSRWEDALGAWALARKQEARRVGSQWVSLSFLQPARRAPQVKAHAATLLPLVTAAKGLNAVFLARHLTGTAGRVLGWNERLQMHRDVQAAWQTADEPLDPEIVRQRGFDWLRTEASLLDRVDRPEAARTNRRQLAEENPFHLGDQLALVNDLWHVGAYEPAIAHLKMLIRDREPWSAGERDRLYRALAQRLWERRQLQKLHDVTKAWTAARADNQQAWLYYLSSLFLLDRDEEADAWIEKEIATRPPANADKTQQARMAVAVQLALGDGWNFSVRALAPDAADRLYEAAVHFSRMDGPEAAWARGLLSRIQGNWRFGRTDAHQRLLETRRADLVAENALEQMDVDRLHAAIHGLSWDGGAVETGLWEAVCARLQARWERTSAHRTADRLADLLLHVLDAHEAKDAALVFVRKRLARSAKDRKPAVREDLVRRLLAHETGGQAIEDEINDLVLQILAIEKTDNNRRGRAAEFARLLADRYYTWRYEATLGPKKDRDGWTRAERKQRNKEARTTARNELIQRLATMQESADAYWKPWLLLERVGYGLQVGADVSADASAAMTLLDNASKRADDPLDRLMRQRAAIALAYACARKNAPAQLVSDVLARLRKGLEAEPQGDEAKPLLDWRHHIWRLLMALDRPDELATTLRAWVVPAKVESRWRIRLGYLEAELGRLEAAIAQFDAAHAVDELEAGELHFLAKLHLVRGNDAARNVALDAALSREPDWQLNNRLWQDINRLSRRGAGISQELGPETLRLARVLLRKATYPASYVNQIARLYKTTKDHRVLEALAFGIPGHTKEALYGFLARMERITREIHEEATCDALIARLQDAAKGLESAVDRRGMHLAIARTASRAAQVKERDPAHAARALEALRAAKVEAYVEGEPRLLADYFAKLGHIPDAAFAAELRTQAQALFDREPAGSRDRIQIGFSVAIIEWTYGDHEAALARVHALLREARGETGRIVHDQNVLERYVRWLLQKKRFRVAEQELLTELGGWKQAERRRQLRERLYRVYVDAVLGGGATSRGRGRALFDVVTAELEREIEAEPVRARQTLDIFLRLVREAHKQRAVPGVAQFLGTFLDERFPALLARRPLVASRLAHRTGNVVKDVIGFHRALRLLLDVYDAQPRFVKRMETDLWSRHANDFAHYRYRTGRLGALEPRLLALVVKELEKNLRAGGHWRGSSFWSKGNRWYWAAKEQDFADVANRVAELETQRPRIVVACARLLFDALRRRDEGVDVLRGAYDRGGLDRDARALLVAWYEELKRFAPALPIAKQLVAEAQDNLAYRLTLARVQLGLEQSADALGTLQTTETRWKEGKRWTASVAAQLGRLAATDALPEPGVAWLEEALRLRQEDRGNRGGQDHYVALWYGWLAEGRSRLGRWPEALSAATAALQATQRNNRHRREAALKAIRRVIEKAPDLPAFSRSYESEAEKTGVDATVIRRSFATVFLKRAKVDDAIRHLLAARELDGRDADVHRMLVKTYDKAGRAAEAIEALFGSIRLAPHNLPAYSDLARRYAQAGNAVEAERARTTLVEPSPNQPDGHRALAQLRGKAGQHAPARVQWEQVVRTAPLDPTGWLGLGDACLQVGDKDAARKAFQHVIGNDWESHYGEVKKTAAQRLAQIG